MGVLLCYFICRSLSVSLFWSDFRAIPDLYANISDFHPPPPQLPPYVVTPTVQKWWGGGGGVHGWQIIVCVFVHRIIMTHDLICQPEAWFWVPVHILAPRGTRELSSMDHVWVWYSNRDWNVTVNPASHMQNGFIHFRCHELTQICEYDQGFPPYHGINRKNKWRNFSPWLWQFLLWLPFLVFYHQSRSSGIV